MDELEERLEAHRDAKELEREAWADDHSDVGGFYNNVEIAKHKPRLTGTYNQEGKREDALEGEASDRLEPLQMSESYMRSGGPKIAAFQDAFNLYRIPMSLTLEALGRVQDVRSIGAPVDPKDLTKAQKDGFKPFSEKNHNENQKQNFHHWADAENDTKSSLQQHMGHVQQLQGVQKKWQAAGYILQRQAKQQEKGKVDEKLASLNKDAEFVGQVVDLVKTVSSMGASELTGPNAQLGGPEGGTVVMLIRLIGGAAGLEQKIAKLQKDIDGLNAKAEKVDIMGTKDVLLGLIREYQGGKNAFRDNKDKMRKWSAMTGHVTGKTEDDPAAQDRRLVTMLAEGYQELVMFGDAAKKESKNVMPLIPAVREYATRIKDRVIGYNRAEERQRHDLTYDNPILHDPMTKDAAKLDKAGGAVVTYDKLVDEQIPEWRQQEKAWRGFFGKNDQ